jgi:hypothetical protein
MSAAMVVEINKTITRRRRQTPNVRHSPWDFSITCFAEHITVLWVAAVFLGQIAHYKRRDWYAGSLEGRRCGWGALLCICLLECGDMSRLATAQKLLIRCRHQDRQTRSNSLPWIKSYSAVLCRYNPIHSDVELVETQTGITVYFQYTNIYTFPL